MTDKKPERTPEELRAKLLADPATSEIAMSLGIPVETYIEKVIDYALHPDKTPTLHVLPEKTVKSLGGLTAEDVNKKIDTLKKLLQQGDSFEEKAKKNIFSAQLFDRSHDNK